MVQVKVVVDMKSECDEEVYDLLAKEIQQEIDNEILVNMLQMNNWTRVDLPRFKDNKHAVDIKGWIADTLPEGSCSVFGVSFMFKEKKYAEWFSLRWL